MPAAGADATDYKTDSAPGVRGGYRSASIPRRRHAVFILPDHSRLPARPVSAIGGNHFQQAGLCVVGERDLSSIARAKGIARESNN